MRKILLVCGLLLLAGIWGLLSFRGQPDHYGNPFRSLPAAAVQDLVAKPEAFVRKDVRIEGELTKQCPATGCWFFLKGTGGKDLKIEMGDTTPRLPARLGRRATVEGQLIQYGDAYEFVGTAVEFE